MSSGIFHVQYKSTLPDHGEGLVVIKDGSINGGDNNYLFFGTYEAEGNQVKGALTVKMWRSGTTSITGEDNYELEFEGNIDFSQGILYIKGTVPSMPGMGVEIRGTKISDAA